MKNAKTAEESEVLEWIYQRLKNNGDSVNFGFMKRMRLVIETRKIKERGKRHA